MKRHPRPRRLETSVDISTAIGNHQLESKHRPSFLAWLRGMRPRWNHGFLPCALPTRPLHPHRIFYQLDLTAGIWKRL